MANENDVFVSDNIAQNVHNKIQDALNALDNYEACNKLNMIAQDMYIQARESLVRAAGCAVASEVIQNKLGARE